MCSKAPSLHQPYIYWLRALHLFYAGLFAFVLPLICWGAQATPGHPHARAHFVFMMPPLQASAAPAPPVADRGGHHHADMAHTAQQATQKPVEPPVGRSVPAMMGATLLLLVELSHTLLPFNADGPPLCYWLTQAAAFSFKPLLGTPPPRSCVN